MDSISCKDLPERDIKNANRVNILAFLWAGSLCGATFLSKYDWYSSTLPVIASVVIHGSIGVWMILAFKKLISEIDELERKIQLDALALSVGITIVGFSTYSILQDIGSIPVLRPAYLIALMSLSYSFGLIGGRIRYR